MSNQQNNSIELTEEEHEKCVAHCTNLGSKIFSTSVFHPLAFARVLMQLGHEPFPLAKGRTYLFFGRSAYFLPNVYTYLNNIYLSRGFGAIYTGLGAHLLEMISAGTCAFAVDLLLNKCYPEVGGNVEDLVNENQENLGAYQYFRLTFRHSIRQTITTIAGIIISRPFNVVLMRQIAQFIGNEAKYAPLNPFQPLMLIGAEEGPGGLFAGLIPSIIAGLISVWGIGALRYATDLALKELKEQKIVEEEDRDFIAQSRRALSLVVPLIVGNIRYPFELCSTLMAVTGSGLAVSLLPYSPLFAHWSDVYIYLGPTELRRGAKMFLREEKGSIRVGADNKLYASKKHFI